LVVGFATGLGFATALGAVAALIAGLAIALATPFAGSFADTFVAFVPGFTGVAILAVAVIVCLSIKRYI
jgi:hypothetical protein